MVRNEIAVLKKVSMGHQNILTLVDYFETMNNCTSGWSLKIWRAMTDSCDSVPRY
jgi:hypothetical protein